MLDMGFIPDVEEICKKLPFTRQTLFYSATMPPEIQRLTDQFLHNPKRVEVSRPATTAENIVQEIIDVPANDWAKREALRRLVRDSGVKNAIVFCNRKRDVDVVAKSLIKHGFNAAPLHGDLDQSVRTRTLDGFRNGSVALLVASDVAARGLDIPAVSHIFNFDVPFHPDDYVHRIGRTGRAGRSGHAFMLASPRDGKYVEAIEKLTGNTIAHRSLEGLAEATQARPHDVHRDHKRGGRNGQGGRDKDRNRPVRDHGHRAAQHAHEPVRPTQVAPVAEHRVEAPHVHQAKPENGHQPRAPKQDHHAKPAHKHPPKPQHHGEPKQPDAQQLPAFLLRPVNLPKPAVKKA
jgi:superfamily II DNA/RNA helicase